MINEEQRLFIEKMLQDDYYEAENWSTGSVTSEININVSKEKVAGAEKLFNCKFNINYE